MPEIKHVFDGMNASKSGLLTKQEFMNDVKLDVPVPLGSVVNVKELLISSVERHLNVLTQQIYKFFCFCLFACLFF